MIPPGICGMTQREHTKITEKKGTPMNGTLQLNQLQSC